MTMKSKNEVDGTGQSSTVHKGIRQVSNIEILEKELLPL